MRLTSPITITPPSITRPNGEIKTLNSITLNELDLTIIDNAKHKIVKVQIRLFPGHMILWEKEAYDLAGDYTQAQVEARVTELLGNDPKRVLEELFLSSSRK